MAQIPSPYRLYKTASGTVVKAGHPGAAELFVCVGGLVDEELLAELDAPEAKAIAAPPENKMVAAPKATKTKAPAKSVTQKVSRRTK